MKRYIYSFLVVLPIVFSGCIPDPDFNLPTGVGDGSLNLNIGMPLPVQKDMTRAVPSDFNDINNLNIIIATGHDDSSVITHILYLGEMSQAGIEALFPGMNVTYAESAGTRGIHFSKEWVAAYEVNFGSAFFLLANWGNRIDRDADRIEVGNTVGQLRNVEVNRRDYAMFGESTDFDNENHTHSGGRSLKVELKRLVAMITVRLDGTGLNQGVSIIPVRISLHNVPDVGVLGGGAGDVRNVITGPDRISPRLTNAGTPAVVANGQLYSVSWGELTNETRSVGGHYTEWVYNENTSQPTDVNWSNPDVVPLFMYENYHGYDFGEPISEEDQEYKRPAASIVGAYSDTTPDPEEIEAVTGACSYIQVEARYTNTVENKFGSVTYRMFLGGNTFDNFDVLRNTYYRLTLSLSGRAIDEGSYSWRVDESTGGIELSDANFVLNGGGEVVTIDLLDDYDNSSNWYFDIDGADANKNDLWPTAINGGVPFIYVNTEDGWLPIDQIKKVSNTNDDGNIQLRLWIMPMIRGITWFGNVNEHKREISFRLYYNKISTEEITVVQYEPIPVTVLADYSDVQDDTQREKLQAIRDYAVSTLGWDLPRTFFIDRVYNFASPWGFENQMILNQVSGLENVRTLRSQGMDYLPYGNGSAMMHAAFMRYYQRDSPAGMTLPTTTDQIGNHIPPANYPIEFFLPSVAEWRLIDMLWEAGVEVEDVNAVPLLGVDYWASDVVEGNPNESYVYRMGRDAVQSLPRSTLVSYRMMYFQP